MIDLTAEQKLRQQIAGCLGIDERYVKVEKPENSDRYLATISRDLDRDLSYLDIPRFDKSIFALECDLEFIKCRFHCKVSNRVSNGGLRDIRTGLDFSDCIFQEEVDFSHSIFMQGVKFTSSAFTQGVNFSFSNFQGEADFTSSAFTQKADFTSSTFKQQVSFSNSTFQQQVSFSDSTFEQQANFSNSTFEQLAIFSNSKFEQQAIFFNSTFQGEVYFFNSTFKQQANFFDSTFQEEANFSHTFFKDHSSFWQCHFEKTANFYSATFKKVPNFSQALFRNHLNAVNIQTDFGFDEIKQAIEQTKKKFDQHNPENKDKRLLANFANDFRDSFRIFKSTLIKENNLLDASNYHKMELYAKELELSYRLLEKKNLKDQDANKAILNQTALEQESTGKTESNQTATKQEDIKESDAKTAPEQNQNTKDKDLKTTLKQESTKEMNNQESQHQINFFQILTWLCDAKKCQNTIDLVQLIFYRHTSDHHTDLLKIIGWILAIIGIFGVLLFACRYGLNLENFLNNHSGNAYVQLFQSSWIIGCQKFIIGGFYLIILLSVIGLFFTFLRWIFMISPLFVVLSMILIQPKYILGIGSLFGSKISQNPYENLLMVAYSIVMLLLLFSLQKTARKNSVMPT